MPETIKIMVEVQFSGPISQQDAELTIIKFGDHFNRGLADGAISPDDCEEGVSGFRVSAAYLPDDTTSSVRYISKDFQENHPCTAG